jgi:hypothetical protein
MNLNGLGKIVQAIFPKHDDSYNKFGNDYDSKPCREFDGKDTDVIHGNPAFRDILILKNEDAPGYSLRPIVAVNGCAMIPTDTGPKLFYNITVHNITKINGTPLPNMELSPGIKLTANMQQVLKSDLEKHYAKVDTVQEKIVDGAVKVSIDDAVTLAIKGAVKKYGL